MLKVYLKIDNSCKSGYYGTYKKLTSTKGVKMVYSEEEAFEEGKIMEHLSSSGFTPKFYGVVEVNVKNGEKRYGILMEHIEGKCPVHDPKNIIRRRLEKKLSSYGVYTNDLHNWNMIKKGRKYYAIDFSPERTFLKKGEL